MLHGIYGMKSIGNMKVFVLGSSGMLGRYISKYLSQFYNVVNITRAQLDAADMCGISRSQVF